MVKLKSKSFFKKSKVGDGGGGVGSDEIKWELRPGGMLVQKRNSGDDGENSTITVKVSTGFKSFDIPIEATSSFGELKIVLSLITDLEPKAQRILFRGKEREDNEFLHMVGVRNMDKVFLLEDPAIKEGKLLVTENQKAINV